MSLQNKFNTDYSRSINYELHKSSLHANETYSRCSVLKGKDTRATERPGANR